MRTYVAAGFACWPATHGLKMRLPKAFAIWAGPTRTTASRRLTTTNRFTCCRSTIRAGSADSRQFQEDRMAPRRPALHHGHPQHRRPRSRLASSGKSGAADRFSALGRNGDGARQIEVAAGSARQGRQRAASQGSSRARRLCQPRATTCGSSNRPAANAWPGSNRSHSNEPGGHLCVVVPPRKRDRAGRGAAVERHGGVRGAGC